MLQYMLPVSLRCHSIVICTTAVRAVRVTTSWLTTLLLTLT